MDVYSRISPSVEDDMSSSCTSSPGSGIFMSCMVYFVFVSLSFASVNAHTLPLIYLYAKSYIMDIIIQYYTKYYDTCLIHTLYVNKLPLAACTFHFFLFMIKQSFHGFFILYKLLLDLESSAFVSCFDSEKHVKFISIDKGSPTFFTESQI